MLSRLRVKGFKSLLDVEVLFGPFTCFIGPNAAGKSNIFDAIRFLSLLADNPIMQAVAQLRESGGRSQDPRSLFTQFGKFVAPEITIEADMIVEPQVEDDFGVEVEASKAVLRYRVGLRLDDRESPPRVQLVEESLDPISREECFEMEIFRKSGIFENRFLRVGTRTRPYISFEKESGEIGVHQDRRSGRLMKVPAQRAIRTALSGVNTSEYPTALAAKKELQSWQAFMLEPSAIRAPSSYRGSDRIDARGANLPAAVHRLQRQEKLAGQTCAELTNRLAQLVDDVRDIRVINDEKTETFTLEAKGAGDVYHAARSLSDGTLRFLALSVLSIDPATRGLICLEEPENGIHPERVSAMVTLLRDIAVDPSEPLGPDNPLRQVVVNTHSPDVLQSCVPDEVIYVGTEEIERGSSLGQISVIRVPEQSWRRQKHEERQLPLSLGQLEPYTREGILPGEWGQLGLKLVYTE